MQALQCHYLDQERGLDRLIVVVLNRRVQDSAPYGVVTHGYVFYCAKAQRRKNQNSIRAHTYVSGRTALTACEIHNLLPLPLCVSAGESISYSQTSQDLVTDPTAY
jgi:hypothetical protein